jgi:hypothetical protein
MATTKTLRTFTLICLLNPNVIKVDDDGRDGSGPLARDRKGRARLSRMLTKLKRDDGVPLWAVQSVEGEPLKLNDPLCGILCSRGSTEIQLANTDWLELRERAINANTERSTARRERLKTKQANDVLRGLAPLVDLLSKGKKGEVKRDA